MKALEMLEEEFEKKRAKLLRQMEVAKHLPTNGVIVSWVGEGGWQGNEKLPDIIKTCELTPWLFHDKVYATGAHHILFKAPDSFPWTNGTGESTSSKFRSSFQLKYIEAVLKAFKPYQIGLTACKGRYQNIFPTSFNFLEHKDYADAKTVGHGECEVSVTRCLGEHSFTSGTFSFHASLPVIGLVKIDVELPHYDRLAPVPKQITRYGSSHVVSAVGSWAFPPISKTPVASFRFGGGDSGNRSSTVRYLFSNVDDCLESLDIKF